MSDSPSPRPVHVSDLSDDADREVRIEQILVRGLDHYVAGQYERAINVWTRVVFLDRRHDRARAYIERARAALAERQRRSEECLYDGVTAYNAGDIDTARDLLTRALEQGSDGAEVFLARLNRVGATSLPTHIDTGGRTDVGPAMNRHIFRAGHPRRWTIVALCAACVAGAIIVSGLRGGIGLSESRMPAASSRAQSVSAEPLPVILPSEVAVGRARTLRADGRLRDALRELEDIRLADPSRAEANRLRAEIQEAIFVAAGMSPTFPIGEGERP